MARSKHNKQIANKAKGPDKNRAPGKSPSKSGRKRASEEDSHSDSGSGKEEKRSSSSSDSRTKTRQKETDAHFGLPIESDKLEVNPGTLCACDQQGI